MNKALDPMPIYPPRRGTRTSAASSALWCLCVLLAGCGGETNAPPPPHARPTLPTPGSVSVPWADLWSTQPARPSPAVDHRTPARISLLRAPSPDPWLWYAPGRMLVAEGRVSVRQDPRPSLLHSATDRRQQEKDTGWTRPKPIARAARSPAGVQDQPRNALSSAPPPSPHAPMLTIWPVANQAVTSPFGWRTHPIRKHRSFHHGIDLPARAGAPIRAFADGTVTQSAPARGYGNLVVINHGDGWETRYAHAQRLDVEVGQRVRAGESIAAIGQTGLATGPHLHFEIRHQGRSIDPAPFRPSRNEAVAAAPAAENPDT